jgi:hypothetical protein
MRKVLFITTLLAFIFTSSVWGADISGTWTVTMKSPQGQDESFDLAIKAAGENLTITCNNHSVLQTLEGTGTLKGDVVKMDLKSTGQQMAGVKLIFSGKVTGNKMAGTREIDTAGMSSGAGAAGGGQGQAAGGQAAQGRQGAAPSAGGQAPAGSQGAAPGGAPAGGAQAPAGGAPGGQAQGAGGAQAEGSNAWTAVKK